MTAEYFYAKGGAQFGPCSPAQLKELVQSGQLQGADLIWKEGMANWMPVASVQGLALHLPATTMQPMSVASEPPPAPARRPPQPIQEGAPRSRRERDFDDDDEEEYRPRRKKKKKKKKKRSKGLLEGMGNGMFIGLIGGGIFLLFLAISIFAPKVIFVPMIIGALVSLAGGLWFLGVVFSDSAVQGLLCFLVPFYSLIYLVTHWEETKNPFFLQLIGSGMILICFCAGIALGVHNE